MLDKDLAELYGTDTGRLKEQVRRNLKRFPADFMFELTREEIRNLSQIVISSGQGIRRPVWRSPSREGHHPMILKSYQGDALDWLEAFFKRCKATSNLQQAYADTTQE